MDLVYSTALRLVGGDTHRAQDVAQTAFVDLARLAGTFSSQVRLGGWLHRHTCFVAANVSTKDFLWSDPAHGFTLLPRLEAGEAIEGFVGPEINAVVVEARCGVDLFVEVVRR